MSLKELKRIITTSLELEDMDVINGLRDKLKSRLDSLLLEPPGNANGALVKDIVMNDQWKCCQTNRGIKMPKMAGR